LVGKLVRPEISINSSAIVHQASDHLTVVLEVEWEDTCTDPQVQRVVPICNKTDVSGLKTFLRDKFALWAINSSSVKDIRNNFKNILYQIIESFVHTKDLEKIRIRILQQGDYTIKIKDQKRIK